MSIFLPVEAAYDRWSRFYDSYENPMVWIASEALQSRLAKRVAAKSVFEFGCGTGRNLARLDAAGARELSGCDLSDGMLAVARSRIPRAYLFRHEMSQPLPEGVGTVDAVLFSLTLEHVEDLAAPLAEARRIVRPDGDVCILEIHPFLSLSGVAAHFVEEGGQQITMPTYPHQFGAYLGAFAEAGLHVLECREWCPRDVSTAASPKVMKRGPDFPMLVEFRLEPTDRRTPTSRGH